jgi:hypothetical protein
MVKKDVIQRIQRRLHWKGQVDGVQGRCIGWYGSTDTNGYPQIGNNDGVCVKVHRLLFAKEYPNVDIDGWAIGHKCRDKGCLNVAHMLRLTPSEARSRWRSKKLNWDIVRQIRRMPPHTNWAQLARDIRISISTMFLIRKNQAWSE